MCSRWTWRRWRGCSTSATTSGASSSMRRQMRCSRARLHARPHPLTLSPSHPLTLSPSSPHPVSPPLCSPPRQLRKFLLEEHGVTIRDRADMPNKEMTWFVGRGAREDELGNETEEGRSAREAINMARWKYYDKEGDENAAGAAWAAAERARQAGGRGGGDFIAGRGSKGGGGAKGGGGGGSGGGGGNGDSTATFYGDYDEADEYLGYDDSGDGDYDGPRGGRSGRGRGGGKGGKGGGGGGKGKGYRKGGGRGASSFESWD